MDAYHVSRATVREAFNMLRQEGVIERRQGTGTFVISRGASTPMMEAHGVFRPKQNSIFERHTTSEIDRSWVPTPDAVAARLGSEPEAPCLRVEYVAAEDGEVLAIATNYVLDPEASSIGTLPLAQSWYELLDRAGLVVGDSEFIIGCMIADEQTTAVFSTEPGSAMLTAEQVIWDAHGRAYNFAYIVNRSDRTFVSRARQHLGDSQPL
jgi:GntR family transcriptional regulator